MKNIFYSNHKLIFVILFCLASATVSPAVNSKVTRHNTSTELLKGEIEKVVIGSRGTIQLGRAARSLVRETDEFSGVWSINSIVVIGGTVYFGTSPNGGIYKYSLNKISKIYPTETEESQEDSNNVSSEGGKITKDEESLSNEHIFAMAADIAGRLLIGISGDNCRLCRFDAGKMEVVFEPNDAKYIFAIAVDKSGNIYLGTGPEGKVYKLDSLGKKTELVYDSPDKNILSLAVGANDCLYAGSDSRGLIYRINPRTKSATVLYDSKQPEIAALLLPSQSDQNGTNKSFLYAAATSAKIVQTQSQFAALMPEGPPAGRPEIEDDQGDEGDGDEEKEEPSPNQNGSGRKLEIANTMQSSSSKLTQPKPPITRSTRPSSTSSIYKISEDGFVTEIFSESAIFFSLAQQDNKLLVGTGNNAQLFSVDPASEQQAVIFENEQAVQITAIAVAGNDVYLGTANPALLMKLEPGFASEGTYISDLIDAEQPAQWGKLQLEADIPAGCKVLAASRSGNVEDINDPTFSQWTEPVEITEPIQLQCPLGRFCQYKLILQSENGDQSPLIREIAVASTVPNLAPQIESVTIDRLRTSSKQGTFKISYRTKDENEDKLIYTIDFRKIGWTKWIELTDDLEATTFEWDGKTVEDGRYEIRITASDEKSNTTSTKLTGSRISEQIVVDNTGPIIAAMNTTSTSQNNKKYMVLEIETVDQLSAIETLEYTIDSNADWTSTVPDDLVYDTTKEHFTIKIDTEEGLPKGDHILTIKVSDAVGNTTYKTCELNVD
ncbi:MAG: hypothetical protein JW715_07430 [Sedimentisphaerales bacterium]|nr:hypothetical protein [Sedimentisphaerales bacterium]